MRYIVSHFFQKSKRYLKILQKNLKFFVISVFSLVGLQEVNKNHAFLLTRILIHAFPEG
jgi:hypothetical protein